MKKFIKKTKRGNFILKSSLMNENDEITLHILRMVNGKSYFHNGKKVDEPVTVSQFVALTQDGVEVFLPSFLTPQLIGTEKSTIIVKKQGKSLKIEPKNEFKRNITRLF